MIRILLYIITLFLFIGCASTNNDIPVTISLPKKVHIDPRIFEECAPLKSLDVSATFEDVLSISIKNAEIYYDCRSKQENSIKIIKEFSNIQENK